MSDMKKQYKTQSKRAVEIYTTSAKGLHFGRTEICEYFRRAAASTTPGDGSHDDQRLTRLVALFWHTQRYPVGIKESKCRAA